MSFPVVPPTSNPTQVSAPSSADATTAGALAQAHGNEKVSATTKIGSLDDLKKKAPKVYDKMMQSIGMTICSEMQRHQDRLKTLMRQNR